MNAAAVRRVWPRRLRHQLLFLLAAVTSSTTLVLYPLGAMQSDLVFAVAFAGIANIVAVYAFVARALRPLQRLVRFSGEIGREPGVQLPAAGGSR